MKKLLIAGTALAALLTTPALAADMARPVYKAPPPPAPVYSWTGFYLGINGGYGWQQSTGNTFCINPAGVLNGFGCELPHTGVVSPRGGLFGGQAGYNWQVNPSIVLGLEADIQWSDIKSSGSQVSFCCFAPFPPAGTSTETAKLEWFGTARARAGVLVTPNALLYITGGLIYGEEKVTSLVFFPVSSFAYPGTNSSTRAGGTVGGGLEYAFTPNFSAKVEGLWYDMGSLNTSFTCPAGATTCTPGFASGANFKFKGEIIRGGLNWKFSAFGG